jgi:hypothetical protein
MLGTLNLLDRYNQQTTAPWAGRPGVNLLLEPLPEINGRAGWDWTVWLVSGRFEESETLWHGAESSFDEAKLSAMEAATELAQTISAMRPPDAVTLYTASKGKNCVLEAT